MVPPCALNPYLGSVPLLATALLGFRVYGLGFRVVLIQFAARSSGVDSTITNGLLGCQLGCFPHILHPFTLNQGFGVGVSGERFRV